MTVPIESSVNHVTVPSKDEENATHSHPLDGHRWKVVHEHRYSHFTGPVFEMLFDAGGLRAEFPSWEPYSLNFNACRSAQESFLQALSLQGVDLADRLGESGFELDAEGQTLFLPSVEIFQSLFPDFKIREIEGVPSNDDFIEAWMDGVVLVSSGKKFVHDMFAHVLPLFNLYSADPEGYKSARLNASNQLLPFWKSLQSKYSRPWISKERLDEMKTFFHLQLDVVGTYKSLEQWNNCKNNGFVDSEPSVFRFDLQVSDYMQQKGYPHRGHYRSPTFEELAHETGLTRFFSRPRTCSFAKIEALFDTFFSSCTSFSLYNR